MSPRVFAVGLTSTLLVSFVFYSWLMYALGVPFVWLAAVMGQVGIAEIVIGVYGYRRWLLQRQAVMEGRYFATTHWRNIILFLSGSMVLSGLTTYFMWRGFSIVAIVTGVGAAATAYALARSVGRVDGSAACDVRPERTTVGDSVPAPRTVLFGVNAGIPIVMTIVFLVRREFGSALFTSVVSAIVCPWAIRKIRRDLRGRS